MKAKLTEQNLEHGCNANFDWERHNNIIADLHNNSKGDILGFECDDCKNKGNIMIVRGKTTAFRVCECMGKRNNFKRIEKSGLSGLLERYTFDSYKIETDFQKYNFDSAKQFCDDNAGCWFYMGGQVGSGKTHLCTAIVSEFLKIGFTAKYMLWRDEIVKLRANVNNDEEYQKIIEPLKRVKVLYIDDFFKTETGKNPTTGDINVAFEILNYRYNNDDLITIISSERYVTELIDIDEAVGSRVYQKTKRYCLNIGHDQSKNYRLKD